MRDFVFRILKIIKKPVVLSVTLVSTILVGSTFLMLRAYFNRASSEVVENWLANEMTNIQQGNMLSSVTKLQRTFGTSALLSGVVVRDHEGHNLLEIGNTGNIPSNFVPSTGMSYNDSGIFERIYGFSSDNLRVFIFTESAALGGIVAILAVYFLFIIFAFSFFIRSLSIRQERIRSQFEIDKAQLQSVFDRRIGAMAKQVAHDIRSPLSVLDIISKRIIAGHPAEGKLLGDASRRIIDIAENLLQASRDEHGYSLLQNDKELDSVRPGSVSNVDGKEVVNAISAVLEEKRLTSNFTNEVKFSFYYDPDLGAKVLVNISEFKTVISNLLNNSLEAISGDGFVTITASNNEENMLVEIRDSGCGMPADLIEKIFSGPVSYGKSKGNGLGLYSSIDKIKSWGGAVYISSKPGFGTCISLTLVR